MNQYPVFLLLGANLGERESTLKQAVELISDQISPITAQSQLYETAPWGVIDQPAFLNQVIQIETELSPMKVLERTLKIEKQLGRERRLRWGARVIDIDILYYADLVLEDTELQLPHPRLHERRFTLVPLTEIAADFIHPVLRKTNRALLNECMDASLVNVFVFTNNHELF